MRYNTVCQYEIARGYFLLQVSKIHTSYDEGVLMQEDIGREDDIGSMVGMYKWPFDCTV